MRLLAAALTALLWVACTGKPQEAVGKVWPLRDFFNIPKATFSGFPTARIATYDGGIPWRTSDYEGSNAVADATKQLVIQPAFAQGDVAAYVITEIWDTHPDPWVQPVYHVVTGDKLITSVLGVGVGSTFYSPYWRRYDAQETGGGTFESVADIVNAKLPQKKGPLVLCPIVPDDLNGLAKAVGQGAMRPFSHEPIAEIPWFEGYADGVPVTYLDFGPDRQTAEVYEEGADGVVDAADFYMFAKALPDAGRALFDLPAVLSDDAQHHAYVRRVDVFLDGEAVFVPAGHDALRMKLKTALGALGQVPDVDPGIDPDLANRYMLRVAKDGSCFADAGAFPQGCSWLDSETAIDEGVPPSRVLDSTVTLTATPVLLGGKSL